MTTNLLKLCDEIEALLKEAMPGPWIVDQETDHGGYVYRKDIKVIAALRNAAQPLIDAARESVRLDHLLSDDGPNGRKVTNAQLVRMRAELDKVRKDADRYQAVKRIAMDESLVDRIGFDRDPPENPEEWEKELDEAIAKLAAIDAEALKGKP